MNKILIIIFTIFIFAIFMTSIIGVARTYEYFECKSESNKMNVDYSSSFFSGCMFKINNKWIPKENLIINP